MAIYLAGLVIVVLAVWVFLTQTPIGKTIPPGVALALILLLVGIGVMASAQSINDARYTRRVVRDDLGAPPAYAERRVYDTGAPYAERVVEERGAPSSERVVEERRLD